MSVRDEVIAVARRLDEDAWVALANRGLVRRAIKDLDTLPVEISGERDSAVLLQVAARTVTFPIGGPAQASCSCPATRTCQHIITAGLWLARQVASEPTPSPHLQREQLTQPAQSPQPAPPDDRSGATAADVPTQPAAPDRTQLHSELMAISADALRRHAGLPGYRWAHQYLLDTEPEEIGIHGTRNIAIILPRPALEFRYVGGGLDGFICDRPPVNVARYLVAAVLAYQRAHGLVAAEPERASPPPGAMAAAETRRRVLAATVRLLIDTISMGLSHLSSSMLERYESMATWAQGAGLYRLARQLRGLADQIDLLLQREARSDEQRLLDGAALSYALVTALEASGEPPPALVGTARTTYHPVRSLELVGLGGLPWLTGSGYQGLTVLFYASERGEFLSWTDARPLDVPDFDPVERWQQPGPWSGLGAPSQTAGRALTLTNAQVSELGRLSGVERTSAEVRSMTAEELLSRLPVTDSWAELAARHDPAQRSLLNPPPPLRDWAVLRPVRYGKPRFDLAAQTLSWPFIDAAGAVIQAVVPYAPMTRHLITRIEGLDDDQLLPGTVVVARISSTAGQLTASPLSLIRPAGAGRVVNCLPLDAPPRPINSTIVAAMAKRRDPIEPKDAVVPLPGALIELQGWLRECAERGTAGASRDLLLSQLGDRRAALARIGLGLITGPGPEEEPAAAVLRTHYVTLQLAAAAGATSTGTGASTAP